MLGVSPRTACCCSRFIRAAEPPALGQDVELLEGTLGARAKGFSKAEATASGESNPRAGLNSVVRVPAAADIRQSANILSDRAKTSLAISRRQRSNRPTA